MPDSPHSLSPYQLWRLVRRFRLYTLLFGVAWFLLGILYSYIGANILLWNEAETLRGKIICTVGGSAILLVGAGWLIGGVNTIRKRLWALYLVLGSTYVFVLLEIWLFFVGVSDLSLKNVFFLTIMLAVIVQTHRIIGWAHQLHQMGLPLTIRMRRRADNVVQ